MFDLEQFTNGDTSIRKWRVPNLSGPTDAINTLPDFNCFGL